MKKQVFPKEAVVSNTTLSDTTSACSIESFSPRSRARKVAYEFKLANASRIGKLLIG